jgi:hypothetical protein
MAAVPIVAWLAVSGTTALITKIICNAVNNDRADSRKTMPYEITIERETTDPDGRKVTSRMTFKFATLKEMLEAAEKCTEICNAPIENRIQP